MHFVCSVVLKLALSLQIPVVSFAHNKFLLAKYQKLIEIYHQICDVYGKGVISPGCKEKWRINVLRLMYW